MQSVSGAQFLSIAFSFELFMAVAAAEVWATIIILFTRMYTSMLLHKFDFSIKVLILI